MAYWVHVESGEEPWYQAKEYDPPAPQPDGKLGYRVLCVELRGMTFRFSSREQLDACIKVLSCKPLPSSKRLSALRGSGAGPNQHWLSRLPASIKSFKGRQQVIEGLRDVVRGLAPGNVFRSTPVRGSP
jgi:hypothetical protein